MTHCHEPTGAGVTVAGDTSLAVQERLADSSSMARHAFAANTIRAWRADWEIFGEFCRTFRVEAQAHAIEEAKALGWDLEPMQQRESLYAARQPWTGDLLGF